MSRKVQNFISRQPFGKSKNDICHPWFFSLKEDLTTGDIDIVISKDYFADLEHNISS